MPDDLAAFTADAKFAPEAALLRELAPQARLDAADRAAIRARAQELVRRVRAGGAPGAAGRFLAEYGLSSPEGVALMCLAEALPRVPDAATRDALIRDRIAGGDWRRHLGGPSRLVDAGTLALMLAARLLGTEAAAGRRGPAGALQRAARRLSAPAIRLAAGAAVRAVGRHFVLAETIEGALRRARPAEAEGGAFSYDMLGEAAMTRADAERYARRYAHAIDAIAGACADGPVEDNPGISVKLSALHCRYEAAQEDRVVAELAPVVLDLARRAKAAGMGFNVDAEEQDRLVLSLKVVGAVLGDSSLAGWDGFGVAVQAYGKRAGQALDWLHALAGRTGRRMSVRLVKGAYWDTELKHAQAEGHPGFPVFTSRAGTDASYIALARRLLDRSDRLRPQFATHNAHTAAAVLRMAGGRAFEFQRLHGMGERLHGILREEEGARCRIYAPVGAHRDLLAYLVRRLLENGANSSFVHQLHDEAVAPEEIAADPFGALDGARPPADLAAPADLFLPARANSRGFDLSDAGTLARIEAARPRAVPDAAPIAPRPGTGPARPVASPASGKAVAYVTEADAETVGRALADAAPWDAPAAERAAVLRRAADLYEEAFGEFFAALALEAGKTWPDAVGELREAADFLRHYAAEAERTDPAPRGTIAAISPWNFPLAIFTGQVAAALAAGNAVLAKPAGQTPLVAAMAVRRLLAAGVPAAALQLLPGGGTVGAALASDPRVDGVAFTGSTRTARAVQADMARALAPGAPLVAETGGVNAMVVDSTALPEQVVRDVVASAFRSAGQRCSALRCLYLQEDIAAPVTEMLRGAMDALVVGDPWNLATDVGPVIDDAARRDILAHVEEARGDGRVLHQAAAPDAGRFVPPTLIRVGGIRDVAREVFGPVLHVAAFAARDLDRVVEEVNGTGHGLTFGLHTRIEGRARDLAERVRAGNVYVNRNQVGAVVGSQPFGGEGLSGTGPKAGGPHYLARFAANPPGTAGPRRTELPGPTGESNTLRLVPRGPLLCLGPGREARQRQAAAVGALGGRAVAADGLPPPGEVAAREDVAGVLLWDAPPFERAPEGYARALALALAERPGPIVPLIAGAPDAAHVAFERHVCVDTTAAGGNAALLAG